MLVNGAHHARELTSISMTVYLMLRLLHSYVHEDVQTKYLLENTALFVVPVVNFDGFKEISDVWEKEREMLYVRKNRHAYDN